MARVQNDYQRQGIGLQATPAPMIQTEQARFDPNADRAAQLLKALSTFDVSGIVNSTERLSKINEDKDKEEGQAYFNSKTLQEIGTEIKEGKILASRSPVFRATVEHMYGENTLDSFQRDTISKINAGELTFKSTQDMDAYLTENRNTLLKGASPFAVGGFDRGYGQIRQKFLDANAQKMNSDAITDGIQQAHDNVANILLDVTDPKFDGTPEQAAGILADRYTLLRKTQVLPKGADKEVLNGLVLKLADTGNKQLLDNFLNQKLDGHSIAAVLGPDRALSFQNQAERKYDEVQRERIDVEIRKFTGDASKGNLNVGEFDAYTKSNEKYITTPVYDSIINNNLRQQEAIREENQKAALLLQSQASYNQANQIVGVALAGNNLAFLRNQFTQVVKPNGEIGQLDVKKAAIDQLNQMTKDMPLSERIKKWSGNDIADPELEKEFSGLGSNLASIGWQSDGKPMGQFDPKWQSSIDKFITINKTNPAYAQKVAGSNYDTLSDIQFLTDGPPSMPISNAAAFVNQVKNSGITPGDSPGLAAKVNSAVDSVIRNGMSWDYGIGKAITLGFLASGNTEANVTEMRSTINRLATLYLKSGQVRDADSAVAAAADYLKKPEVTTRINGTIYFNKDLPHVPEGQDPSRSFEEFIKGVPGILASQQDLPADQVRLSRNSYGGYTAWVGNVPLTDHEGKRVEYSREFVGSWISKVFDARTAEARKKADQARVQKNKKDIIPPSMLGDY